MITHIFIVLYADSFLPGISYTASMGIFSVASDRTMYPGVDSASKNEYQGFLLG